MNVKSYAKKFPHVQARAVAGLNSTPKSYMANTWNKGMTGKITRKSKWKPPMTEDFMIFAPTITHPISDIGWVDASTGTVTCGTTTTTVPTSFTIYSAGGMGVVNGSTSGLGAPCSPPPIAGPVVPQAPDPDPRHLNRYLNASDLLEEFVREMSGEGVKKHELLDLPVNLLISWLIIRAAKDDGEPVPEGVAAPRQLLLQRPDPKACRICRNEVPVILLQRRVPFCSRDCVVIAFNQPELLAA